MAIIEGNIIKNFINIEKIDIKSKAGIHGISILLMWLSLALYVFSSLMSWTIICQILLAFFGFFVIIAFATQNIKQKKN